MLQQSLESFFHAYGDMVFRYCALHTQNLQDAQDIYQEVFLKLYQKQPDFKNEQHAKAWLLRVSVNLCKNYHRARLLHPLTAYHDALHITYEMEEPEPELLQKLRLLPEKYRSALYLHFYEGYTFREIGQMLGCREATARTWVFRGKQRLQILLQERP